MKIKFHTRYFLLILILVLFVFFYLNITKKETLTEINKNKPEEAIYSSNTLENVNYVSEDAQGNRYIIDAAEGEIDLNNSNLIYLTNVIAFIELKDSDTIKVTSNYGKYNINNYDTIFSKNVIINYLDNKITGEYLDFSFARNTMIISKKVVYTNIENILKADVIEIDVKTKDTKIFMHESNNKINVKNKD